MPISLSSVRPISDIHNPMGDAGGDPDWYGYCLDDPVNGIDPLGLAVISGAIAAGAYAGAVYGPTVMRGLARLSRPATRLANRFGASIKETINAYGPDLNVHGGFVTEQVSPEKPSYLTGIMEAIDRISAWKDKIDKEKAAIQKTQAKKEALAEAIANGLEEKKALRADANARAMADREAAKRSRERARQFVKDAQDRIDRGNDGSPFDDGYGESDEFADGGWYGRQAR